MFGSPFRDVSRQVGDSPEKVEARKPRDIEKLHQNLGSDALEPARLRL